MVGSSRKNSSPSRQSGKALADRVDVALGHAPCIVLRILRASMKMLRQLTIARIPANHVLRISLKEILDRKLPLGQIHFSGRHGCHLQKRVLCSSVHIFLQLRDQRGDKVKHLGAGRGIGPAAHHAVIVLQRMQAHPRQAIYPVTRSL